MKERSAILKPHEVRAILAGTQTQFRRIMKPQPYDDEFGRTWWRWSKHRASTGRQDWIEHCPFGVPGDVLWVRESGRVLKHACDHDPVVQKDRWEVVGWEYADGTIKQLGDFDPPVSEWLDDCQRVGRPSIHMPRWASRLTLRITDVRVERLQDISEEDAKAEGLEVMNFTGWGDEPGLPRVPEPDHFRGFQGAEWEEYPVAAYRALWERIHGPGSWEANPWVWVVPFERITPEHQERAGS